MWFLAHFFLLFRVAPSVVKDWPFRHTRLAQTRFEQVTIVLLAFHGTAPEGEYRLLLLVFLEEIAGTQGRGIEPTNQAHERRKHDTKMLMPERRVPVALDGESRYT
jgi:hypothetical protein